MESLKIFAEIGFGNASFCNTEIEKGSLEHRVARFIVPPKIAGVYIRLWLGKRVFVVSTRNGFTTTLKNRNKFKLLLGLEGSR